MVCMLAGAAIMAAAAEKRMNLHPTSLDVIEKSITIASGEAIQKNGVSILSALLRIVIAIFSCITMFFGLLLFFSLLSLLK
jgi:hypothetical protein